MREFGPVEQETELGAAIGGDPEALRSVWRQHRGWVAAILLAHKPREVDLEDLLQSVALTLVSRISDVRDEGAFRPWLRTVATNIARAEGRRQTTERKARLRLVRPDESESGPNNRSGDGRVMLELARELPDGYREPLLLRCIKGMSYREISKVLELPESTIETRIARGRRMLRELALRREEDRRVGSRAGIEGVADA